MRVQPNRLDQIVHAAEMVSKNANPLQFGAEAARTQAVSAALDEYKRIRDEHTPLQPQGWRLHRPGSDADHFYNVIERQAVQNIFGALMGLSPTPPIPPVAPPEVPKKPLSYLESIQKQLDRPERKVILT